MTRHTEVISVNRSAIVNIKEHLAMHCGVLVPLLSVPWRASTTSAYSLHQHPDAQADELTVPQWMPYEKDYDISVETITAKHSGLSGPQPSASIQGRHANHHRPRL